MSSKAPTTMMVVMDDTSAFARMQRRVTGVYVVRAYSGPPGRRFERVVLHDVSLASREEMDEFERWYQEVVRHCLPPGGVGGGVKGRSRR